jgi:hypothetical protein
MGVVDEPVEDGVGVGRVTDDLMLFIDGDLAGEEGRAAAVAFFEDLVEVAAGAGVEGVEAPIVENSAGGSTACDRRRWCADDCRWSADARQSARL